MKLVEMWRGRGPLCFASRCSKRTQAYTRLRIHLKHEGFATRGTSSSQIIQMPPRGSPPRLTHFLCLPLVTSTSRPQLQASVTAFKDKVTKTSTRENPDGIPEKAIRPLGTLHLTLGVMSLLAKERVGSALKVLKEIDILELLLSSKLGRESIEAIESKGKGDAKGSDEEILANASLPSLNITLRGLVSMHDPSKTSILYSSPVDEDRRLYSFCQKLRNIFTAADLIIEDTRPLLLHATIVNTVYVPGVRGKGSGHGKNRAKLTLDATELVQDYDEFVWMKDVRLEKVAICRMGARKKEDGEEEYVIEGEANMP